MTEKQRGRPRKELGISTGVYLDAQTAKLLMALHKKRGGKINTLWGQLVKEAAEREGVTIEA